MNDTKVYSLAKHLNSVIITYICSRAGSILIEIEKSTILAKFFRIEIVIESIFEKLKKIEIEAKNRDDKKVH